MWAIRTDDGGGGGGGGVLPETKKVKESAEEDSEGEKVESCEWFIGFLGGEILKKN